jgi:hypothetical protein
LLEPGGQVEGMGGVALRAPSAEDLEAVAAPSSRNFLRRREQSRPEAGATRRKEPFSDR